MILQLCATNFLTKWLKADLPRLPVESGKQVGVNTVTSDNTQMCWQVHIIDNSYGSRHKTLIAVEASSRFTVFIPVVLKLTLDELSARLKMEWQWVLAESLRVLEYMPRSDIALLLDRLNQLNFDVAWVKNTDLSINGHISDAGLWVTQTLEQSRREELTPEVALELAIYLNGQPKRINKGKDKVIPVESLLAYCQSLISSKQTAQQSEAEPAESNQQLLAPINSIVYLKR
ncbi:hypothetical protein [Rheinheimera sp. F8]|uniref:DUF6933 domain-containing protein n=1 Tax=Rheinheimera sp. F8 TaxID=1763998 RepID=UPI0007448C3A|nr:hypothetical protein [Rheinheimera sp. F8]ALZ76724.1 amino acid adenylation [Rheinheimera sp. F8]